ncbi:MAG: hypothetical protein WCI20_15410 [bacterium]
MIVIVDKIAGGTNPTWQMALRNTIVAGNVFTVGNRKFAFDGEKINVQ